MAAYPMHHNRFDRILFETFATTLLEHEDVVAVMTDSELEDVQRISEGGFKPGF